MSRSPEHEELIAWLRQSGAYLPESDALLPLMQATFTPEEARILVGMPLRLSDLEELASLKGMDQSSLERRLEEMARRGLVFTAEQEGRKLFRPGDPRFMYLRSIFWPGRTDEYTKRVATGVNRYYVDGFGEYWRDAEQKGLRVLPIRQTIPDTREILPYEDARAVLERHDTIAVAACACRHRKNTAPESPDCPYPLEVCIHFGKFADYIIHTEIGRKISVNEASDILGACADKGLVHTVSNWREGVDTICNCCRCCCVYFEAFHVLKHTRPMDHSNYRIHVDPDACKACGLCVKRCPMDALTLEPSNLALNKSGKVAVLQSDLCIGCGVCAHTCSGRALSLERRSTTIDPPETAEQLKARVKAPREP